MEIGGIVWKGSGSSSAAVLGRLLWFLMFSWSLFAKIDKWSTTHQNNVEHKLCQKRVIILTHFYESILAFCDPIVVALPSWVRILCRPFLFCPFFRPFGIRVCDLMIRLQPKSQLLSWGCCGVCVTLRNFRKFSRKNEALEKLTILFIFNYSNFNIIFDSIQIVFYWQKSDFTPVCMY